jgi:uncharacterized damage-inducible protein DinB
VRIQAEDEGSALIKFVTIFHLLSDSCHRVVIPRPFIRKIKHMEKTQSEDTTVVTPAILLSHWQGHRYVTRKAIEAFPEDKLFTYSLGGMRPFGMLIKEMLTMGAPAIKGVVTGKWASFQETEAEFATPCSKEQLLKFWDESTIAINEWWGKLPASRFQEIIKIFGQWEGPVYWSIFYFIDNEIHHRAQGYVYLRSLGIEPPPFWDRGSF